MPYLIKNKLFLFLSILALILSACTPNLNLDKLSPENQQLLDSILDKSNDLLKLKEAQGVNPNWLEISDLESTLSWKEKRLIKKILKLTPHDLGTLTPAQPTQRDKVDYKIISAQPITQKGESLSFLDPIVSMPVYNAYKTMMDAMEKDLGKRMYIESGHRSLGYHLYNFLKYLREHEYSLRETGKLNALPGYSQHNIWMDHALDLINAEGVNGEPVVEDYENLPEHQWMLQHAGEYGFTLSYPRNNPFGIDFEPWHWKYNSNLSAMPAATSEKSLEIA